MGVKPFVFLTLDGLAALLSVPIWVYLGFYLGDNLDDAIMKAMKLQKYLVAGVVVFILSYVFWILRKKRIEREQLTKTDPPPIPPQSPQI